MKSSRSLPAVVPDRLVVGLDPEAREALGQAAGDQQRTGPGQAEHYVVRGLISDGYYALEPPPFPRLTLPLPVEVEVDVEPEVEADLEVEVEAR